MSYSLPWWVLHAQSSTNSQYPTPTLVQHSQHCKQQVARLCPDKNHRITTEKCHREHLLHCREHLWKDAHSGYLITCLPCWPLGKPSHFPFFLCCVLSHLFAFLFFHESSYHLHYKCMPSAADLANGCLPLTCNPASTSSVQHTAHRDMLHGTWESSASHT